MSTSFVAELRLVAVAIARRDGSRVQRQSSRREAGVRLASQRRVLRPRQRLNLASTPMRQVALASEPALLRFVLLDGDAAEGVNATPSAGKRQLDHCASLADSQSGTATFRQGTGPKRFMPSLAPIRSFHSGGCPVSCNHRRCRVRMRLAGDYVRLVARLIRR